MVQTFMIAMSAASALICVVALAMVFFAILCKKAYGEGTDYKVSQLLTYRQALFSSFQIFTGNWHDIMYAASDATQRETTKLPFIAFCLVITFFFCNLFVGVLLSTFQQVQVVAMHVIEGKAIPAQRLYGALNHLYTDFKEAEREQVLTDFLGLNFAHYTKQRLFVLLSSMSALHSGRPA